MRSPSLTLPESRAKGAGPVGRLGAPLKPAPGRVTQEGRGRSSGVERQLPKLNVVGSIPIARSNLQRDTGRPFRASDSGRLTVGRRC